ncbi:MAG: hypothetical protein KA314_26325 [Chloroflexi bacterium]|nr:hypothetical protein [Chloroflexota bacterium]MBP8059367.1 hypothetical protein [Chloroflexota bacterium]
MNEPQLEETPDTEAPVTYVRRERVVATRILDGVTYTWEWTRCGHAGRCGRCKVAYYGHGPYWYARYWDATKGERGRVITKYIGRQLHYLTASELPDRAPRGRAPEKQIRQE